MHRASLGLLLLIAGCVEAAPPFDELELRDALRAEPAAITLMPAAAGARLADRLETARTGDTTGDDAPDGPAPLARVIALDEARRARLGEAIIVGVIADGVARPLRARAAPDDARPLPPLEGADASETTPVERAALDGAARPALLALLDASGARRLERVTGWPVGAIAIGDTVYVNAAWLVALSVAGGDASDGGAAKAETTEPATALTPRANPPAIPDGGAPTTIEVRSSALGFAAAGTGADGGVETPPVDYACAPSPDSCSSGTDDGSDDSCDGTSDDGCDGTSDDGADDACSGAPDGDPASSCAIAGPAKRGRRGRGATLAWLGAPLGFLMLRRRS